MLKSKIIWTGSVGMIFGLVLFASAQDSSSPTPIPVRSPVKTPIRQEIRDTRKENVQEIKEVRQENIQERKETMQQNLEEMKRKRETFKEDMEKKREELKDRMEQKREELKTRIETKRTELKERLTKIKDERKKQVVERIDKSLDALNERVTKHFLSALEKLEDILARINERTDKAEGQGTDASSVDTAIAVAQAAINDAKAAVEVQADKTYTLTINTEDKLREDVGKTRQALHADLRAVQEKVKVARDAVHEAARAFAKVHGRDLATPSPTVSASPTVSPTPTSTPTPTATP